MIRHYLSLHTNVVSVKDDYITVQLVPASHIKVQDDVMLNAATNLILASYRNQLLHVFVRVAMVALCVNGCVKDTMTMGECGRVGV